MLKQAGQEANALHAGKIIIMLITIICSGSVLCCWGASSYTVGFHCGSQIEREKEVIIIVST